MTEEADRVAYWRGVHVDDLTRDDLIKALSEAARKPKITDDTVRALDAIQQDAVGRGYREGFSAGIAEKAWLHRHWPAILIVCGGACMIAGVLIMGAAQ